MFERSHRFRTTVVVMTLLSSHFLTALGSHAQDTSQQPMIGERAPAFALETVGGGTLNLEELRGQYVVIHFGASW